MQVWKVLGILGAVIITELVVLAAIWVAEKRLDDDSRIQRRYEDDSY